MELREIITETQVKELRALEHDFCMGKFKVGDIVRITGFNHLTGYCNSTLKHLGEETEIIHVSRFVQRDAYYVKSNGLLWFEDELALIDKSIELEEYEIMDLFEPKEENDLKQDKCLRINGLRRKNER